MAFTKEEKGLLKKLASGALDGMVGDEWFSGKSAVWKTIKDGVPKELKQGPTTRFFNGKENERIPGVLQTLREWITDEEKLKFLQNFGWLMRDADVRAYSAKFKPK